MPGLRPPLQLGPQQQPRCGPGRPALPPLAGRAHPRPPGLPTGSRCPPGPNPVPPEPPGAQGAPCPRAREGRRRTKGAAPISSRFSQATQPGSARFPSPPAPQTCCGNFCPRLQGRSLPRSCPHPPSAPFFCLKRGGAGLSQDRRSRGARGCGGLRISGFWGLGVPRHGRRRGCRSRSSLGAGRAAPALPPHFPGNFLFRS